MDGSASCRGYAFRVRLYDRRLNHITKMVIEYTSDDKNVKFFKILGVKGNIMVRRGAEYYVVTWAGKNNGYEHYPHTMSVKQIITTAATMMTGFPVVYDSDLEPTLF